jgi:hypothetical protein
LNGTYNGIFGPPGQVQFHDGVYDWVLDNPPPFFRQEDWRSSINRELVAAGDLDSNGVPDAAVIIGSRAGGSGFFITLAAVLNRSGVPENVASMYLGDRVVVNSVAIQAGEIVLDMLTHNDDAGPNLPAWEGQCCPNVPIVLRFRLVGTELVRVS